MPFTSIAIDNSADEYFTVAVTADIPVPETSPKASGDM
jgi:hypothetical protein